jgi:DNA-binding PadR family transcriptional regulator
MYSMEVMKLEKELVAASTVPLVLAILEDGESYGYAIIARVRELSEGEIEWTDGMLYPVLHWLEENQYVKTRWEKSEAGRKRKYYSLRTDGRKHLADHKAQWAVVHETLRRAWRLRHA